MPPIFESFPERLRFPSERSRFDLVDDCRRVFSARSVAKEDSESAGQTFWLSAGTEPRCGLEQLVAEITSWHQRRLGLEVLGSEWWTLWLDGEDDDVGWHWDADYEARERGDVQHPLLGTVTYLEAGGSVAPTAVLEDCFETELLAGKGAMVARAHLSLPVPGKHICFDGRLLHAAPAQLREIFGSAEVQCLGKSQRRRKPSRTTLLVNIWQRHRPKDPRPLARAVATKLAPVVNTSSFSLGSGDPVEPLELRVGRGTRAREISWQFGEDDLMSVLLPIPETADIKADSIALRFIDGRCGCVG